ncbi:hypothetical protein BDV12DRAFT_192398 [Aspergillus spectabilis]
MKVSTISGAVVALCLNMATAQITIPLPPPPSLPTVSISIPSEIIIPTALPTCVPAIPSTTSSVPTVMAVPNNNQMVQEFERSHPRQVMPLNS